MKRLNSTASHALLLAFGVERLGRSSQYSQHSITVSTTTATNQQSQCRFQSSKATPSSASSSTTTAAATASIPTMSGPNPSNIETPQLNLNERLFKQCAAAVNVPVASVMYVVEQLKDGKTVPFLARYRRDESGSLDELQIYQIQRITEELSDVENRRMTMMKSLQSRSLLTAPVLDALARCTTIAELEDCYEPYRPKRCQIADTAREKGLEPLVNTILFSTPNLLSFEAALGKDITAVSKTVEMPEKLFEALMKEKLMQCPAAKEVANMLVRTRCALEVRRVPQMPKDMTLDQWEQLMQHYEAYDGKSFKFNSVNASTLLALERGANKGIIRLRVAFAEDDNAKIAAVIVRHFPGSARLALPTGKIGNSFKVVFNLFKMALKSAVRGYVEAAINSARRDMRQLAIRESIAFFSHNLRRLLLQRPTPVPLLAMDPGFKSGIKCVILDEKMVPKITFIVNLSDLNNLKASIRTVCTKHGVHKIVIGNGAAARETVAAVANAIEEHKLDAEFAVVSETGASVYSSTPIAAEEFPEMNSLFRAAVSIGRRVQDPLSELVKIPVRSIGVGVYQHDMPTKLLERELKNCTRSCVSFVGVDVETASKYLLQTIPGITPKLAEAIEFNRSRIKRRADLLKVPGMTPELYQTIAGCMRVMRSSEPLDRTIIHPEWYQGAKKLLQLFQLTFETRHKIADAYQAAAKAKLAAAVKALTPEERSAMDKAELTRFAQTTAAGYNEEVAAHCGLGVEAIRLIVKALTQRTFDPRLSLSETAIFRRSAVNVNALKHGQTLVGIVENVTPFGAFVDVGLAENVLFPARHEKFNSYAVNCGDVLENVRAVVKTEITGDGTHGGPAGFDDDDSEFGARTSDDAGASELNGGSRLGKTSSSGRGSHTHAVKRRVAINFDQIVVQNAEELDTLDTSLALKNVLTKLKEEKAKLLPLAIPDGWLQERQSGVKRTAAVDETFAM